MNSSLVESNISNSEMSGESGTHRDYGLKKQQSRIYIEDHEIEIEKLTRVPPDFELAKQHAQAMLVGKSNYSLDSKNCPCCGHQIDKKPY